MFFKQFLRDDLGCASYLIGDTDVGECVVVDPQWDVTEYVDVAGVQGMAIRYVIETHNHADHVSGHGKLALEGARIAIHEGAHVEYPHMPLKDGEVIEVGSVKLQVLHTPGHRPEHIALSVTDTSRADVPWLVLTGDSLFVGDVGRPDLAVEAHEGASQLYRSLQGRLLSLPDGVEIYPAHVSGSLCGKSMSSKPSSTIGFERLYNSPLSAPDEESFVRQVAEDLPPQPPHFELIVEKNRGPFITSEPLALPLQAEEVEAMRREGALVLDVRSPKEFGRGHIPGALNVDLNGGQFGSRASWLIPPERAVVLVTANPEDFQAALSSLIAVGQYHIAGYLDGGMHSWDASGRQLETVEQISIADLHERLHGGDKSLQLLDVREPSEWREGHVPGAINIPFHRLTQHLDRLHSNRPIGTLCGSSTRSSIAASLLKAEGFEPLHVLGGMEAWKSAGYPVESEGTPT